MSGADAPPRTEFPPMTPAEIKAIADAQESVAFSYVAEGSYLYGDYDTHWVAAIPEPRALRADFRVRGGTAEHSEAFDWTVGEDGYGRAPQREDFDDYLIQDWATRENVGEVIERVAHDLVTDPPGFKVGGMIRTTDGNALLGRVAGFKTARTVIVDWNGGPQGMRVPVSNIAPWGPGRGAL